MRLKFIKAQEIDKNVKCAIHKTGKLGFSSSAIEKLKLNTEKGIAIAINEEDDQDENLYVVVTASADKNSFKISKAGDYYYANTKSLFDNLGVDYKKKKIIYDIIEFEIEGYEKDCTYKLLKREVRQKE